MAEARKTVISKCIAKTAILKLDTGKPWETMQAQLLVKIDQALSPSHIQYDEYDIKFYITHVIPKPGLSLASRTDYDLMILKAQKLKDLTINITVVQLRSGNDKENEAEVEEAPKPKKKAVHVFVLVACITCTHPNFRRGETLQRFLEMSIRIGLSKSSVTSTNARKRIVCALVLIVLIPPVVTTSYSAMLTSIVGHWLWYVLKPLILNTN
jgi:hypothetical protein